VSQPLPLVEQLKNLEQLQELDLKIDSIKRNKNSLPASLKQMDDSLNKLKTALDSKKNLMSEIEKTQRQTQAALELNRDRLGRSNSKLEAVHNSQEFQAANKEIEQLKKLNTSLEEQAKKSTADLEVVKKEFTTLEEQVSKLQAERDAQAKVLLGQDNQLKTDIVALESERQTFASKVESKILTQYDRIRGARAGLGIVPALGGRCKGCNMIVPPQLFNEVQRGAHLHSCPSCHRLLFVPAAPTAKAVGEE
jgi:uncharacterized protein